MKLSEFTEHGYIISTMIEEYKEFVLCLKIKFSNRWFKNRFNIKNPHRLSHYTNLR